MAAPTYSTDLTTLQTFETDVTDEMTGHTGGSAAVLDPDYFIQGSNCNSQSTASKTGTQAGIQYDHGSDISGSLTSGVDVFFMWHVMLAGTAMDTFTNGGMRVMVGSSAGNFSFWTTGGVDFGRNPFGGWHCVAWDPFGDSDYTDGSPTGAFQFFGSLPNMVSSVSKGNLHGIDALRYGRGQLKVINGDTAVGNVASFQGFSNWNDGDSNGDTTVGGDSSQYGLFQAEGTGYLWKGLLQFGDTSNPCVFGDSNTNITVDHQPKTYANFNKIYILNASSVVKWFGVNIAAVSYTDAVGDSNNSPGTFVVGDSVGDTPDLDLDTCIFTDMYTFSFRANSTINNTTFRRCKEVTQNSAVFTNSVFDSCGDSISLLSNDIESVTGCNFIKNTANDNNAIELTDDHAGDSFTVTDLTFSGYAVQSGDSNDRMIYNNSGDSVVLKVSGGDSLTYRNGAGATTTIIVSVPITVTVIDDNGDTLANAQTAMFDSSGTQIFNEDTDSQGIVSSSYGGTTPNVATLRVRKSSIGATRYYPHDSTQTITASGLTVTVTMITDNIVGT